LVCRTVIYHGRSHLCLALAVAACTAVITGALTVGDSMRHTLRTLTDQRLGKVRYALLTGGRLFRGEVAKATGSVPVLRLPGIVTTGDGARRVNGVQVLGVDSRFAGLALAPGFPELTDGLVALNMALARRLGVQVGDELIVRMAKPALTGELAWDPKGETSRSFRARVQAIVRDDQAGRFTLENTQVPPLNAYVALPAMQAVLESPDRVNLLLAGPESGASPQKLNDALGKAWALPDRGLTLAELPRGAGFELRSRDVFLGPEVERAARGVPFRANGVFSYLVNKISFGNKATPYSFVAGLEHLPAGMNVAADEVAITDWLAEDLAVTNGAAVTFKYFVLGPLRALIETSAVFRVGCVVPLKDVADPTLMPEMPGMAESPSCRDWESGVPIDLASLRPKDEEYWETWRGAPKAFIHLEAARAMWSNPWGSLTSIRYPPAAGEPGGLEAQLAAALSENDRPLFKPVRDEARQAWSQSLDFGQLFLGLSLFLVVSTVCMMGLLFRLVAGQQIEQAGLLMAVGIGSQLAHGWLMVGTMLTAMIGGAFGLPVGLLYARGLLAWFESLWRPAGTLELLFRINAFPLAVAWGAAVALALGSARFMVWRLRGQPIRGMLDTVEGEDSCRHRRGRHLMGMVWAGLALVVAGVAAWKGRGADSAQKVAFFFLSGACLLALGMETLRWFVDTWGMRRTNQLTDIADLARRNAGRHPGRSMLISGMVACAVFLLVVVVLFQPHEANPRSTTSGTGGYSLMMETDVPISADLNSPAGRRAYGLTEGELEGVGVFGIWVRPGDDAGCGNLSRAQEPRLLGVDAEGLAKRGAFSFLKTIPVKDGASPWLLLEADPGSDVVPAFADENTLMWGLGKSLGDELEYRDERGRPFRVRFVGLLANSVLQGGVLISGRAMRDRYPSIVGQNLFLMDVPEGAEGRVADRVGRQLRDEGAAMTVCATRLAEGGAVTVLYLKLFQTLGGLGLLLGVGVVALVVIRNAWDRQGELALLRAVGFSRRDVAGVLVGEQVWLVGWGMAVGVLAALAAVGPVLDTSRLLSALWPGLPLMLVAVAAGGVGASALAAWAVTRSTPLDALRKE
jgi:hypothetical protein